MLGVSGEFNGDALVDLLLRQPATARFVVDKLWREFVSPQPDPARVDRIAAEPTDQCEIGRHHRDLAELGQRNRQRELDRLGQLDAPRARAGRRRGGGYGVHAMHGMRDF